MCKRHGPCTRKYCGGDHCRPGLRSPRAAGTELRPVLPDSWGLRKEQATSPKQRTLALSGIKAATVLRVGSLKDAFESTRKRMSFDTSKSQSNSTCQEGLSGPHFLSFIQSSNPETGSWTERSNPPRPNCLLQPLAFYLEQAWAREARSFNFHRLKGLFGHVTAGF